MKLWLLGLYWRVQFLRCHFGHDGPGYNHVLVQHRGEWWEGYNCGRCLKAIPVRRTGWRVAE